MHRPRPGMVNGPGRDASTEELGSQFEAPERVRLLVVRRAGWGLAPAEDGIGLAGEAPAGCMATL